MSSGVLTVGTTGIAAVLFINRTVVVPECLMENSPRNGWWDLLLSIYAGNFNQSLSRSPGRKRDSLIPIE